jgi:hypothetical protein
MAENFFDFDFAILSLGENRGIAPPQLILLHQLKGIFCPVRGTTISNH